MRYWLIHKVLIGCLFLIHMGTLNAQGLYFVRLDEDSPWEFSLGTNQEEEVLLSFVIQPGYHIQADRVDNENLIPTALTFQTAAEVEVLAPEFPQAEELEMQGMEMPLSVFSDTLKIRVPLKLFPLTGKEAVLLQGKLHYQPCDDAKCYFPRDLEFVLRIKAE